MVHLPICVSEYKMLSGWDSLACLRLALSILQETVGRRRQKKWYWLFSHLSARLCSHFLVWNLLVGHLVIRLRTLTGLYDYEEPSDSPAGVVVPQEAPLQLPEGVKKDCQEAELIWKTRHIHAHIYISCYTWVLHDMWLNYLFFITMFSQWNIVRTKEFVLDCLFS